VWLYTQPQEWSVTNNSRCAGADVGLIQIVNLVLLSMV